MAKRTTHEGAADTAARGDVAGTSGRGATRDAKRVEDPASFKAFDEAVRQARAPIFPGLAGRLDVEVKAGVYNELAAYVLSVASAWAYAEDPGNVADAMSYLGLEDGGRMYSYVWKVSNGPLLVETTAIFVRAGTVGILCFRGTDPTNVMAWLSDMSFETESFFSMGEVHSGFYDGLRPIWPMIRTKLHDEAAPSPEARVLPAGTGALAHIPGRMVTMVGTLPSGGCLTLDDLEIPQHMPRAGGGSRLAVASRASTTSSGDHEGEALPPMKALYIGGHSLGGAHAVLATALIYHDPRFAYLQDRLRGVYTFGQPLVGDQEFAEGCDAQFGDRLFRHVYGHDVVTHYPPKLYGAFRPSGTTFLSTPNGWTRRTALSVQQTWTLSLSTALGGVAFLMEQIPLVREIKLPYSWIDHKPINYVRCSRLSLPFYK